MHARSERAVTLAGDVHARPAGQLAIAAASFESAIELSAGPIQAAAIHGAVVACPWQAG